MPDSTGNFKGIAISHVPWHLAKENHNLSSHWFCKGEACERDCHCPGRCHACMSIPKDSGITCPRCEMLELRKNHRCWTCDGSMLGRVSSALYCGAECRAEASRLRAYGLDPQMYRAMLEKQQHACAICRKHKDKSPGSILYIDHCHRGEHVRALLCQNCNFALGLLGDDPSRCRNAASYLEEHADADLQFAYGYALRLAATKPNWVKSGRPRLAA